MQTVISKNILIYDPSQEIINWCNENIVLNNPTYTTLKMMNKEDTIRRRHVPEKLDLSYRNQNYIVLPVGCLRAIWDFIKNSPYQIKFNEPHYTNMMYKEPTMPLYDYQEKAIEKMIFAKSGVLVAGCGSGKTFMGIELIKRIGQKALWLCHTGDLLRQAKADILEQYPDTKIGLTTEGKLEIGDEITISTVQTMDKIEPSLYANEFNIVVCDECAHVASAPTQMKMFGRILSHIPARYKFGLTATPMRSDGLTKAMYAYVGMNMDGKFEPTYKIDRSEVKTIQCEHKRIDLYNGYDDEKIAQLYDSSGMMVYNDLIATLCDDLARTNKILDYVESCYKEGRKQVVLSGRVEHCELIVDLLNERGINAKLCTGKVPAKKRKAILTLEEDWDVIVATYSLLKEGVSVSELDTLHLATPIRSKNDKGGMIIQCAGRIERYLENKKQPIVYDYVDTDIPYCEKAYTDRKRALKRRF